jgi:hypothetical protein
MITMIKSVIKSVRPTDDHEVRPREAQGVRMHGASRLVVVHRPGLGRYGQPTCMVMSGLEL